MNTETASKDQAFRIGMRVQCDGYEWTITEMHPEWDAATIRNTAGEKVVPTTDLSAFWFNQP